MIIFTKQHKPLTIKLMFQCMLMSLIMIVVLPHVIEIINYRMGVLNAVVTSYISAVCITLGIFSYILALIGLICSIMEFK